jgi:outer membrane protein TolC
VRALCREDVRVTGKSGFDWQDSFTRSGKIFAGTLICAFLALSAGSPAWGEDDRVQNETVQGMIRIVLENNPTLASQQALLRESEKLPMTGGPVAITGLSFSAGTSFWDPDTTSFRFAPAVTLGTNLSLGDPTRLLASYNLEKERELARQGYQKIKDSLITDLLSTVRDILSLADKQESLGKLKVYLQDYSDLLEKQVRAGAAVADLQKLWDLKERILGIEVDVQDAKNKMSTMKLEAAMRLGGDAWEKLLALFAQLAG